MNPEEKEAIFDALDIINSNKEATAADLVRRGLLTKQQEKRISYLMDHSGQRDAILAEWREVRKAHIHPRLKEMLVLWERSESNGVCEWCGSSDLASCIQGHILESANDVILGLDPAGKGQRHNNDMDPTTKAAFDEMEG